MSVRIGDYSRAIGTMKQLQAHASTADKKLRPTAEKASGELYSDMSVVKLEIFKEGKESVKRQVRCRQIHNNFYGVADPESQVAEVRQAFKEEQERRRENEAFLEEMSEQAKSEMKDFVMQYVRGSISDISKMFGKLDC